MFTRSVEVIIIYQLPNFAFGQFSREVTCAVATFITYSLFVCEQARLRFFSPAHANVRKVGHIYIVFMSCNDGAKTLCHRIRIVNLFVNFSYSIDVPFSSIFGNVIRIAVDWPIGRSESTVYVCVCVHARIRWTNEWHIFKALVVSMTTYYNHGPYFMLNMGMSRGLLFTLRLIVPLSRDGVNATHRVSMRAF